MAFDIDKMDDQLEKLKILADEITGKIENKVSGQETLINEYKTRFSDISSLLAGNSVISKE